MHDCPHCRQAAFRFTTKWRSSSVVPAECSRCGNPSFAPGSAGGTVMVVNALLLALAGLAAAVWQSPWFLPGGAAVALGLWWARLHAQPMLRLTPQQVSRSRKATGVDVLAVVLFALWQ